MEVETPAHHTRDGVTLDESSKDFDFSRSYADFRIEAIRERPGSRSRRAEATTDARTSP